MNRRITKDMARIAAQKVAAALYDAKIDAAKDKLTEFADECVLRTFPAPVIGVLKEYTHYFSVTHKVCIGCSNGGSSIPATSHIFVPASAYYMIVSEVVYKQGMKIYGDMKKLEKMKKDFADETSYLLYQELRFEKKIAEKVPELLSYIEFPVTESLPAKEEQYYTSINNLIKNVKKLKK